MPNQFSSEPLLVEISREAWSDFYTLHTPVNGHSEELEIDDVRQWFKDRGANMDMINAALDQVYNFRFAKVIISRPKDPSGPKLPYAPNI